ncbi:MAG: YidC/Oxa1 family membrane protein insertase [Chloroflexi bacterium]|nr:YidC/Oxa1 family membrane protein insertase [Chloroflexota bacterium]
MGGLWNTLIVTPLAEALKLLAGWIEALGIPYHFGFAIILFTLIIKLVTIPLNKKQLESTKATQELQPKLQELQKKYGKDREKLAQAQMELYKEAGVSPMGGCLPMLIQFPILIGLYSALYSLANNVNLGSFFFIPDLALPSQTEGISWLWPFPPKIGWDAASAYLVLPVLTLISQLVLQKMMQLSPKSQDPQQGMMNSMMSIMPIFFAYITLQVPAGLTLYWVVSNIFSIVQQYTVMGWGGLAPLIARLTGKAEALAVPGQGAASMAVGNPGSSKPTETSNQATSAAETALKGKGRHASGRKKRRK